MIKHPPALPRDPDLRKSLAALQRAAQRARELAIQTNTLLFICNKSKIINALAEKNI